MKDTSFLLSITWSMSDNRYKMVTENKTEWLFSMHSMYSTYFVRNSKVLLIRAQICLSHREQFCIADFGVVLVIKLGSRVAGLGI